MNLRRQILSPLFLLSVAGFSPLFGAEKAQPAASLTSFGAVMDVNVVNVDVYATDKKGKRVNDRKRCGTSCSTSRSTSEPGA